MGNIIAIFRSRNDAIAFREFAIAKGFHPLLINTPRELSISCGLALKFTETNTERIVRLLGMHNGSGSPTAVYRGGFGSYVRVL